MKTKVLTNLIKSILGNISLWLVVLIFGSKTLNPEANPDYKITPPTGVTFYEAKKQVGPDPNDSPCKITLCH